MVAHIHSNVGDSTGQLGNCPLFTPLAPKWCIIKKSSGEHMQNTYKITIKTKNGDELVITQKARRVKHVDNQIERIVNEWVEMLRESGFTKLTVQRVPTDELSKIGWPSARSVLYCICWPPDHPWSLLLSPKHNSQSSPKHWIAQLTAPCLRMTTALTSCLTSW